MFGVILVLYWDNGKENGNYRGYVNLLWGCRLLRFGKLSGVGCGLLWLAFREPAAAQVIG